MKLIEINLMIGMQVQILHFIETICVGIGNILIGGLLFGISTTGLSNPVCSWRATTI
jgi:hypothetical protein